MVCFHWNWNSDCDLQGSYTRKNVPAMLKHYGECYGTLEIYTLFFTCSENEKVKTRKLCQLARRLKFRY